MKENYVKPVVQTDRRGLPNHEQEFTSVQRNKQPLHMRKHYNDMK